MQNVSLTDYQRGYRDALQEVKNHLDNRSKKLNVDLEEAEAVSENGDQSNTVALRLRGLTYAFMEIRIFRVVIEALAATTPEDPEVSHASI